MRLYRSFLKSLPLAAAGFFVCLIFSAPVLAADTVISVDTVWNAGSVHLIPADSALDIRSGANLTIEPGSIIKLGENGGVIISGSLFVNGTAAQPVIFTSEKDDSAGGDSNGDGSATVPAPGDWFGMMVGSPPWKLMEGNASIKYAIIKYGGRMWGNDAALFDVLKAQSFSISSSSIINNAGEIIFEPWTPANSSITGSNIYNPDYPIELSPGGNYLNIFGVTNRTAYDLDLTGNYWGSPVGPSILWSDNFSTYLSASVRYLPFAAAPLDFAPPEQKPLDPVILIPGIMGSAEVPTGNYLPSGKTEYAWALDPVLRSYDNLWNALKLAGYKEGENLFALPYDWRRSNVLTALDLKTKIDEVKAKTGSAKVDLIGHSMGGLVARQYIERDAYAGDVDQLIFLATPHLGSPKAYMMWEAGEFGLDIRSRLMKDYLELEALEHLFIGNNALFRYIRDYPIESVKELLPTYNYLAYKDSSQAEKYPNGYPTNLFIDILNNPTKLAKLEQVKITNIVADDQGANTPIGFQIVSSTDSRIWEYGMPYNYYNSIFNSNGVVYGMGDQTVPAQSNRNFIGNEINLISNHLTIPTDAQKAIIKELTGKELASEVRDWWLKNFIMVRIFSPADFQIVAPDGKIMGKDFATGQAINQIGGYYSGFDSDAEWAVIPNPQDGQYQIKLKGTGEGSYRLSVSSISDATSTDHDFVGSIATGTDRTFDLQLDSAQTDPIAVLLPEDHVPPTIDIISPSSTMAYLRSQALNIDFIATDDFSGVSLTEAYLDDALLATTTIRLFDLSLGAHAIKIVAVDNAGNQAEESVDFTVSTSLDGMLGEIAIAYERGWIKDAKTRDKLSADLKRIIFAIDHSRRGGREAEEDADERSEGSEKGLKKMLAERLHEFIESVQKHVKRGRIDLVFYDIMKADVQFVINNQ